MSETATTETTGLLLYSLASFWPLLEPVLQAHRPSTICEIGIGQGEFTRILLDHCGKNSCAYYGIDPTLDEAFAPGRARPDAVFDRRHSLEVLPALPPQDVYFIDGDHNYYTVRNELRLILRHGQHWPLIFLHDVGWPWGRRDQYCHPDIIPAEFRHPFSTSLGVRPGRNDLGPGGFAGDTSDYSYGAADHEGGPQNGVLTAVEDTLRDQPENGWKLVVAPVVFGLGILYAPVRCDPVVTLSIDAFSKAVAALRPLLELLERNRTGLYLTYVKQTRDFASLHAAYQALQEAYQSLLDHCQSLQTVYGVLLQRYGDLLAHSNAVLSAYDGLFHHAEHLEKAYGDLQQHSATLQKVSKGLTLSPPTTGS